MESKKSVRMVKFREIGSRQRMDVYPGRCAIHLFLQMWYKAFILPGLESNDAKKQQGKVVIKVE